MQAIQNITKDRKVRIGTLVTAVALAFFLTSCDRPERAKSGPHADLIVVSTPSPGDTITSPLTVTGKARGVWYFEASFPLELTDDQGNTIARHYATAEDDWMTEEFVPFEGTIEFEVPDGVTNGVLIFRKDNPSDMPEHDDELAIPVTFK